MTYFLAGAAVLTVGTSIYSGVSAKNSAIKQGNTASKAEGEAIVRERTNKNIQNAYSTAFQQMQLSLRKRQLSEQGANISAATLTAKGTAELQTASTSSIGSSVAAVVSDIDQKSQAALDQTYDAFENDLDNFNKELDMLVLNTDQSTPVVRPNVYNGPSTGSLIGVGLVQGAAQFAAGYASRQMSLGLGAKAPVVPAQTGGI